MGLNIFYNFIYSFLEFPFSLSKILKFGLIEF